MWTIRERTNSFAELCNWLESSLIQLKSSLLRQHACNMKKMLELESSSIQFQSSLIESESSLIYLRVS